MFKIGFDSEMYMQKQSEQIIERISHFDKLYLEFGGKLFDDLHAARVLPGFDKGAKIKLLQKLRDRAELIICINANAIERNKMRADYGITYGSEVERMIDNISAMGIYINCVVITMFTDQQGAIAYRHKLENRGIKVYIHRPTKGYPHEIDTIVSDEGYGANPYIETTRPLVVLTAPGPGSGKLATCLSQLYHENKRGVQAGYAKFETFPIWNIPLNHPVNVAYEAATADLQDVNKVDNFHLDAYGEITVNYNRDIEVFPVVHSILEKITGKECIYKSPTDMGVNMAGYCIVDDEACREASKQEIIRRYCKALCDLKQGSGNPDTVNRLEFLMSRLGINLSDRNIVEPARAKSRANNNRGAIALELPDGRIVTGKNSDRMSAAAACIFNSVKMLAGMNDKQKLISPYVIGPILDLKTKILKENHNTLTLEEALLALSICAATDANAASAIEQLSMLENCEAHSTHILSKADENPLRKLGVRITCDAEYLDDALFIE